MTSTLDINNTRKLSQDLIELKQIEQREFYLIIHNFPELVAPDEEFQTVTNMIKEEFKLITKIAKATRLGESVQDKARIFMTFFVICQQDNFDQRTHQSYYIQQSVYSTKLK